MKKKILIATAAFLMTIPTTFAKDSSPVPDHILTVLRQDFDDVKNVEWKTTSNFYKASFVSDGLSIEAFYSPLGQLIAQSRQMDISQLPMGLIKEAKKIGKEDQVSDLFELLTDRGTEYFITFNTGKDIKTYKSNGYSWSRY